MRALTLTLALLLSAAALVKGAHAVALLAVCVALLAFDEVPRWSVGVPLAVFVLVSWFAPQAHERIAWLAQASVSDYVFPCSAAALLLWRKPSGSPWPAIIGLALACLWIWVGASMRRQDDPAPWLAAGIAAFFALTEQRS